MFFYTFIRSSTSGECPCSMWVKSLGNFIPWKLMQMHMYYEELTMTNFIGLWSESCQRISALNIKVLSMHHVQQVFYWKEILPVTVSLLKCPRNFHSCLSGKGKIFQSCYTILLIIKTMPNFIEQDLPLIRKLAKNFFLL